MNSLSPLITPELQARIDFELKALMKNNTNPIFIAAVKAINEFIAKYHQKTLASFALIALHSKMGLPYFLNPSAREFKEDLAKMLTHMYIFILDANGVPLGAQSSNDIYGIIRKMTDNFSSIRDRCDQIQIEKENTARNKLEDTSNIVILLLQHEMQSKKSIPGTLEFMRLLIKDGLIESNNNGFNFETLDDSLSLLAIRFENAHDITGLLNKIILTGQTEGQIGQMAEYLLELKNEVWPQELYRSYSSLPSMITKGVQAIISRGETALLYRVRTVCINDKSIKSFKNRLLVTFNKVVGASSSRVNADLFFRLINLRSSELKSELLACYQEYLAERLKKIIEDQDDVITCMVEPIAVILRDRSEDLAEEFKDKVLNAAFVAFSKLHKIYDENFLLSLLRDNSKLFLELHKNELKNISADQSSRIDFFNLIVSSGICLENNSNSVVDLAIANPDNSLVRNSLRV